MQAILPKTNIQTMVRRDSEHERVSVFDVITACNLCRNARGVFAHLQKVHATELSCLEVQPHRFAGKKQVPTPTIPTANIPQFLTLFLAGARMPIERKRLLLNDTAQPLKTYTEVEIHSCLSRAFGHLHHAMQHNVGVYFCDMVFFAQPGLQQALVLECDERDHKGYSLVKEQARMLYITDMLRCRWLRYDPYAKDFDVFTLCSKVSQALAACNQPSHAIQSVAPDVSCK